MAESKDSLSPNTGKTASAMERLREMMNVPPSTRDWGNPLEKIEELLSCAICLDRFKTPKLLQCQHTFCMECLEGLEDPVRRQVKCPECRAEHPLPYEGVKGLQTNYTLMGFLEIHLQATEDNAEDLEAYIKRYNLERCRVCDEKAEVDFCHHCQKKVCTDCKNTHLEMVKRDLGRLTSQVKRLSNRVTEASDGLSKGIESLCLNCEASKEDVREAFKRFLKDLKKREEHFITEIDTFHAVETRLMKGLRDSLELESSNVNEACARVEAFMKGEREVCEEDVVKYKQMFSDGLEFLRTFSLDADDLCMKKVRFTVSQDTSQQIHQNITQFGELQVCAPQFGGRFQQLEAHYVPRVLNVGLESDISAKKRNYDLNDTSTWGNQQGTNNGRERKDFSGRHGAGTNNGTATTRGGRQEEDTPYSLRFRRRHQLEEEAWHRLRGDRDRKHTPETNPRRSPRIQAPDDEPSSTSHQSEYARQQLEVSPFSKVQNMSETNGNSATDTTTTGATASASASTPTAPTILRQVQKSSEDDTSLNLKVEHIRQEHNQKKTTPNSPSPNPSPNPNPSTTPLNRPPQLNPTPPHFVARTKATAAASASIQNKAVKPTNEVVKKESEEEEESSDDELAKSIPIIHYPPTPTNNPSPRNPPTPTTTNVPTPTPTPPAKQITAPPTSGPTIDWKKYLIPSPLDRGKLTTTATGMSSFTDETLDRSSRSSSKESELSWAERRKRFVRSKTNPDLLPSASQSKVNEHSDPSTTSRYMDQNSRTPTGTTSSAVEEWRRNRLGTGTEAEADTGRKRDRYKRKTERSNTTNSDGDGGGGGRQPKHPYLDKGRMYRKFGTKGGGEGQFNWPRGIALVPASEEIAVCDSSNHRVQLFDKRGNFLRSFGGYGSSKGEFDCLAGITINKYKQFVVTDRYNHRVQIFDSQGRFIREFGSHGQTNGRFNNPWGVVVDNQGFIYVCDKDNHRVQIFQADGNFVGKFGGIGNRDGQFQNPHFIAVSRQNMLLVTDSSNHRVQVFDHNGHFQFSFGSEGFQEGQFKYPRGIAVDDQGFILVADSGNNRIQVFYPDGRFYVAFGSWGAGEGQLKGVEGVSITVDGRLIVTDRENHRIQIF